jgi:hydroxypyruvate isomerase
VQVLYNLPAGDWAGGERGIACHPDRTTGAGPAWRAALGGAG